MHSFDSEETSVPEFWLIVTLCAMPTVSDAPYGGGRPIVSSDCAEYRLETSFSSIQDCRLQQIHLNHLPLEPRRIMASLCTARLDPARLGELPLLSSALGDHA
jgi:hypothetical protein